VDEISETMATTSAHDSVVLNETHSNSDDSDANESDSDANKSDSDVYFKSDDSDSNDEYDRELHERLTHEEMARIAKLEDKTPTKPEVNVVDFDKIIEEELAYFDDPAPQSVEKTNRETNESKLDNDSDSDNSEEEMPDESDDDRYNGYGRYDEYGGCDRGYYYRDGRYERKVSLMMSPIISPVTAC
jgi:hypothetical protein